MHEHSSRSGKLAHQTFSAADAGDNASACYTFHDVFAVPGDEMAVIDDVLFAFHKLGRPLMIAHNILEMGNGLHLS